MMYEFKCKMCGKIEMLDLDEEKVAKWQNGELIQKVFPELTADQREIMISGICGNCFDDMFS